VESEIGKGIAINIVIGKNIVINIVIGKNIVIAKISSSIKMRNMCLSMIVYRKNEADV